MNREVCFTISDVKNGKRTRLAVVWLSKRQLEGLMFCYYSIEQGKGGRPWAADPKTHRELKAKRMITKLHATHRVYYAIPTVEGKLVAESIDKAAKQGAKKRKRKAS
jgi:hypothetical protein